MALDREDTLKKAEKLLRTGRLDAAIVEYAKVVEDEPTDWATTNMLGDLYVRAGQSDRAASQYRRIADHFMREGFYPKAAALYKKLLKLTPEDEAVQLNLADISHRQGLLADAKAYLNALAVRRRNRGDKAGAADIVVRLGSVDPADIEARLAAARTLVDMGDEEAAAARFRGIYDDLAEKNLQPEALSALREAVRLNPYDRDGRVVLARAAVTAGDMDTARAHLDRETAGDDPALLAALLEVELESGRLDDARRLVAELLALGPDQRLKIVDLAWTMSTDHPEAAFVLVDAAADALVAAREFREAASVLQAFVARAPGRIPALQKLVEVCVDGGFEATMVEAQAQLADAHLEAGQPAEARVIAEDLVAREPWERVHIERFRRALVMMKVPDPDTHIAERLNGQSPFTATDPFADGPAQLEARPEARDAAAAQPPDDEGTREPFQNPVAGPTVESGLRGPAAGQEHQDTIDVRRVPDLVDGLRSSRPAEVPEAGEGLTLAFQEFRQEVRRQSGADHSARHMTLARTYLEMGMRDEAMDSLVAASRSPQFRFEAASLLGRIHAERGETTEAIEFLERAAEAPAPTVEEGRALLYDLGVLVEKSGETTRALAIFLELQSEAGEYRDVAERVGRLARVEAGG